MEMMVNPKSKSVKPLKKSRSSEFQERKELIEIQHKRDVEKHKLRMKEMEYQRESDLIHHKNEMERQRIKSAEIRKMQERKMFSRMQ